ncbi:hypothetical protein ACLOJK_002228 [Asimina triloba]
MAFFAPFNPSTLLLAPAAPTLPRLASSDRRRSRHLNASPLEIQSSLQSEQIKKGEKGGDVLLVLVFGQVVVVSSSVRASDPVSDVRTAEIKKGSDGHNLGNSSQKSSGGQGGLSSQFRSDQFRSTQCNGKLAAVVSSSYVDQLATGSVSPQSTAAHSVARKSQMMNGNHLLNFHYDPIQRPHPRPQPRTPPPRKPRKARPYNKDLFLQANFKFVVLDSSNYSAESIDPDKMFQWEDVLYVRYSTPFQVQCPICLDGPLCSQITSCGHVFCFPCILRYLLMGEEDHKGDCWKKCPLCFMMISSKDLYTVHIDYVKQYNVGDLVNFTLLTRQKDSLVPYQKEQQETGFIPDGSDGLPDAFSKFHLTSDVELSVRAPKMELNEWLAKAESGLVDDLEQLPYVCAALEQLERRQKCWVDHQSVGGIPPSRNCTMNGSQPSKNCIMNGSPPLSNCNSSVLTVCKYNPSKTVSHANAEEVHSEACETAHDTLCTGCSYESNGNGQSLLKLCGDDSVVLHADTSESTERPGKLSSSYDEGKNLQRPLDGCKDVKERDFYSFYQMVKLCEIDLSDILPPDALSPFMDEIKKREKQRKRVAKKENEEKAKAEAALLQARPFPSGFRHPAYNETTFSIDDFKALGTSTVPSSTSSPVVGERKRFSEVTRLGFAAAHDSPSLKMDEPAGDTPSNREAHSDPSSLAGLLGIVFDEGKVGDYMLADNAANYIKMQLRMRYLLEAGELVKKISESISPGARPATTSTLSFANIISTAAAAQSSGGAEPAKMSGLGKRGKKPSRVLLSTAGGRRY